MRAYLWPDSNFMYIMDGDSIHICHRDKLSQGTMSEVISYLNHGNLGYDGLTIEAAPHIRRKEFIDECVSRLKFENNKCHCRAMLEIVLNDTYSDSLRGRARVQLVEMLDDLFKDC